MVRSKYIKNFTVFIFSMVLTLSCFPKGPRILTEPFTIPAWSIDTGFTTTDFVNKKLAINIDDAGNSNIFNYQHNGTEISEYFGVTNNLFLKKFSNNGDQISDFMYPYAGTSTITKIESIFGDNVYLTENNYTLGVFRLLKIGPQGILKWSIDNIESTFGTKILPNQQAVIVGMRPSLSGNAGATDLLFEHYDAFGKLVTAKIIASPLIHGQNRIARAIAVGADGNIRLALFHNERCATAQADLTLLTIDLAGNILHSTNTTLPAGVSFIDSSADIGSCLADIKLHDNNGKVETYILTGGYQSSFDGRYLNYPIRGSLLKYNNTGVLSWIVQPQTGFKRFQIDTTGAVLLYSWTTGGYWRFQKFSSIGQSTWSIDESSTIWDSFKETGHVNQGKNVGNDDGLGSRIDGGLKFGSYGSIYLAVASSGDYPAKLAKISIEDGTMLWAQEITNPEPLNDIGVRGAINLDANDNVYFTGNQYFDGNHYGHQVLWSGVFVFDAAGNPLRKGYFENEILMAKMDSFGNLYWLGIDRKLGAYRVSKIALNNFTKTPVQ